MADLPAPAAVNLERFRQAFKRTAGGVSVITVHHGDVRSGMTATSVVSFSADPAELLITVNPDSSSFPLLQASRCFGVNMLTQDQREIAGRFSGFDGVKGEARYANAPWYQGQYGAWLLPDAAAALECEVHDIWLRSSGNSVVIGRIKAIHLAAHPQPPLVYTQGRYTQLETA
jgi:flavin reductase (DIM6/NTAB) family NADH-FMN oxidoreductase RutF